MLPGFFTKSSHTEYIDDLLRSSEQHLISVKLSGDTWAPECCEQPGLAATLFSSTRLLLPCCLRFYRSPSEVGWEHGFMAQLANLTARRVSDRMIEITVVFLLLVTLVVAPNGWVSQRRSF